MKRRELKKKRSQKKNKKRLKKLSLSQLI